MDKKICFYCHSKITKKNDKKAGKQMYKRHVCGKQFTRGNCIDVEKLWDEYQKGDYN